MTNCLSSVENETHITNCTVTITKEQAHGRLTGMLVDWLAMVHHLWKTTVISLEHENTIKLDLKNYKLKMCLLFLKGSVQKQSDQCRKDSMRYCSDDGLGEFRSIARSM